MWDKACYHFHTHPKKTKPCCQAAPELVSFTLRSFYSLFWPQLPGSLCDVSPLHMPLKWIRCCLRHCWRRDMTEQEHDAAWLCNILWKEAEIATAPLQRAGLAKNSVLTTLRASSEQWFQLSQIWKCWERRCLFPGYKQQQAQMFPVAVTLQNLPQKRSCGCCVIIVPSLPAFLLLKNQH